MNYRQMAVVTTVVTVAIVMHLWTAFAQSEDMDDLDSKIYIPLISSHAGGETQKNKNDLLTAPTGSTQQVCNTPAVTANVTVPQWNNSSGWLSLTTDPSLRASITGVQVTVNANGTSGNSIHILENWGTEIASEVVDSGTIVVQLPANTNNATLQFYIGHAIGSEYEASLMLCTGEPISLPQLSISDTTVGEGDGHALFTVTLSEVATQDVTFGISSNDGTALAGSDYVDNDIPSLTIEAGTSSEVYYVPINDDGLDEPDETFSVLLSNASGAEIATGQAAGTILDNDTPPSGDCDTVAATPTITVPQWNANSGWKPLTTDPALRPSITGVEVTVISGGPGNIIHILENWGLPPIASQEVAAGTILVSIPPNANNATLQFYIEHVPGSEYQASLVLCTGDGPSVPQLSISDVTVDEDEGNADFTLILNTASNAAVSVHFETSNGSAFAGSDYTATSQTLTIPAGQVSQVVSVPILDDTQPEADEAFLVTLSNAIGATLATTQANGTIIDDDQASGPCSYDPTINPQPAPPSSACELSHGFGAWSTKPGVVGTLSQKCIELHDSYWVLGVDDKAYHTWHPAGEIHPETGEGCVYGHEHGDDPASSPLLAYSGGWPAFGSVLEQFSGPRHEDHFGHKVTIARYRASIGNPPNSNEAVYDAGFYCDFMSKIHQGAYSEDAFTNHIHEYFLSLACDDDIANPGAGNIRTQFSIKTLIPFGAPNMFFDQFCADTEIDALTVSGFDGTPLPSAQVLQPVVEPGALNHRGLGCVDPSESRFYDGTVDFLNEFDLWTQPYEVKGPNGLKVFFQPYYIAKDAARGYEHIEKQVRYLVDLCYESTYQDLKFCEDVVNSPNLEPFNTESPFRGALRAINFKTFQIDHNSTSRPSDEFCTNEFGEYSGEANNGQCPANEILQKITKGFDGNSNWWSWVNPVTGVQGTVFGSFWVEGQPVKYPVYTGSSYIFIDGTGPNGLVKPNNDGSGCPGGGTITFPSGNPQHGYCPVGIGFEKIADHRNDVSQTVKDLVGINPNTNEPYNQDIHAPN